MRDTAIVTEPDKPPAVTITGLAILPPARADSLTAERSTHVALNTLPKRPIPAKAQRTIAPGRFELPTSGLGNRCSILLSYGATARFYQACKRCDRLQVHHDM